MDKLPPSIEQLEQENWQKIKHELDEHLAYLTQIYNLAFKAQSFFFEKKFDEITVLQRALLVILMRITDFLRSLMWLLVQGYPEQACTLASSIFELTHTACALSKDEEKCNQWCTSNSIDDQMPKAIGYNNWHDLIKSNCHSETQNYNYLDEYRVYKQLCWAKHSLPKMCGLIYDKNTNSIAARVGPHCDDMSINHAWFGADHSGRLTEWVIAILVKTMNISQISSELEALENMRKKLRKKAIERFGQKSPFEFEE